MLLWPDVMVHVCNPITGKVKAGGQEFEDKNLRTTWVT
jgi:hypothetical protein